LVFLVRIKLVTVIVDSRLRAAGWRILPSACLGAEGFSAIGSCRFRFTSLVFFNLHF